ncbi:MAG TPA: GNAT family N-acetyltransferase [Micromonosporaceae bacterium]
MTLTSTTIEPLADGDPSALLATVLTEHDDFWDGRDLRGLHHPVWFRQFSDAGLMAWQDGEGGTRRIAAYLLGSVTRGGVGYVHLIAVRSTHRRAGLGRALWARFVERAWSAGAHKVQAITTPTNSASIAFHTRLGLAAELIPDYAGPGQDRVLFHARLQPLRDRLRQQ